MGVAFFFFVFLTEVGGVLLSATYFFPLSLYVLKGAD